MNNKDIQDVGETVAKNERKKRNAPARPNQQPKTNPGDNTRYLRNSLKLWNLPISDKRFKMIWAAGKVNLMAGASGQKKNYECIYTNQAR